MEKTHSNRKSVSRPSSLGRRPENALIPIFLELIQNGIRKD